ncbi:MAG: hypothetical protein JXR37_24450 [Kiritimatiellae bacterium]|nr:hypothetical protein [Kiritimatiellia bacterium]
MNGDFPTFKQYDAHFVHRRLALGPVPEPRDAEEIRSRGIRGIINLVAVCARPQMAYVQALPLSIQWRHLGFWDGAGVMRIEPGTISLTPVYAQFLIEQAALFVREYSPVLIHCVGGVGRSGNVAALLYAALEGVEPEEAVERMRAFRPQLARFSRESFWRDCRVEELVQVARRVLTGEASEDTPPFVSCVLQG